MDGNYSQPIFNTISRVCERTGLGRSKLYELIATGELVTVKIGRRTLISEGALKAWAAALENKQHKAPAPRIAGLRE